MPDTRFHKRAGPFTLAEVMAICDAAVADTFEGALDQQFSDVAPLDQAGEGQISFLDNRKYVGQFRETKAAACLVHPDYADQAPEGVIALISEKPYRAYAKLAQAFYPEAEGSRVVAATAVVADSAELDPSVSVGDYAVIGAGVKIGADTIIAPHAVIEENVQIGSNCRIGSHASISIRRLRVLARTTQGSRSHMTMKTTSKIAFLFPGQGSQAVGMGRDLYLNSIAARDVFDEIDEILGRKLTATMFEGPAEELSRTENTQPAIMATSIATWRAMEEATGVLQIPNATAGHSLGEYSALVVSGVLSVTDAVKLVLERGRLMQVACEERPGGMVALIGVDEITAEEVCRESGAEMSTINTAQQIILSGDHRSLAMAIDIATVRGAKKAIPLQVGGAFHSGLMSPAQHGLNQVIDSLDFHDPFVPLIGNVNARSLSTGEEVREELRLQLTSCVQWNNTVQFMLDDGIQNFYEIGHGRILSGMVKRIDREASASSIGDFASVLGYASAS